jgi:hypothetical protein
MLWMNTYQARFIHQCVPLWWEYASGWRTTWPEVPIIHSGSATSKKSAMVERIVIDNNDQYIDSELHDTGWSSSEPIVMI